MANLGKQDRIALFFALGTVAGATFYLIGEAAL
jgi:hypothetical protein